jgi:hypothetical protein
MSEGKKDCNNCKHIGTDCEEIVGLCVNYDKWEPKAERDCTTCFHIHLHAGCEGCGGREYLNWKPLEPVQIEIEEEKSCNTCNFSCSEKETDICFQRGYACWVAAKPRFPDTPELASDEVPASEPVESSTLIEDPAYMQTFGPLETDPNGLDQHEPGAKLDAGKNRMGLVLGGFATALEQVSRVGTEGAAKYTDNGWMEVKNGPERYIDAALRHIFEHLKGKTIDPDFNQLHLAHASWDLLAALELISKETT